MSLDDRAAVDRFLATLDVVSAVIDLGEADRAIREGLQAVGKQLAALNAVDYRAKVLKGTCVCAAGCGHKAQIKAPWKPDELARAANHTMRVVDEAARLAEFARGRPDSRPDTGAGTRDLLSVLTAEQLAVFEGWIVAAQGRGEGR